MHFDSQMGGISLADCRLPRISLVFREMWGTTNLDVPWSSSGELSAATTFRTLHPNNQLQGPANHLKLCHPACPGVPWEQSACLWQVEREMTLQNRHGCEARRAGRET